MTARDRFPRYIHDIQSGSWMKVQLERAERSRHTHFQGSLILSALGFAPSHYHSNQQPLHQSRSRLGQDFRHSNRSLRQIRRCQGGHEAEFLLQKVLHSSILYALTCFLLSCSSISTLSRFAGASRLTCSAPRSQRNPSHILSPRQPKTTDT